MKCDREAIYMANVQGVEYTARMPLREGATPPESIYRQGNFLTLQMVVRSEDVAIPTNSSLVAAPSGD